MAGSVSQHHDGSSSPVRSSLVRLSNPNIFSDDFALEPLNASGNISPTSSESSSDDVQAPRPTPNSPIRPSITTNRPESRFYTDTKLADGTVPRPALTHPEPTASSSSLPHRTVSISSSNATTGPQRTLSTSSRFSMPRPQSPYTGATGPSHPYGMYPQVTRNSSVTTASTNRPAERAFVGGAGPEHPYSMYPQNTVDEEDDVGIVPSTIPVGFPGMGQDYRTRVGPTGDTADIIGPDGHTEQLPPYTRYPDDMPPKAGTQQSAVVDVGENQTDSPDTLGVPQSRLSSRTMFSDTAVELNTAAARTAGSDSSGSFKERWKERSKKRVCCGIPLWGFGLVLFLLVGIVIGGALGGVVGSKKDSSSSTASPAAESTAPSAIATATVTSWLDSTHIPTPPYVAPLPLGQYNLPTNTLKSNSDNCIVNQSYNNAWGCMGTQGIGITTSLQPGNLAQIQFESQTINSSFTYGPQPPDLGTQPFLLTLTADKDAMGLGPSFFFFDLYDKLVILPEDSITPSPTKRSVSESELLSRGNGMHRERAQLGDRPWFCWWNQTVVEFFIYVNQNTTEAQNGWESSSSSPVVVTQSTGAAASATSMAAAGAASSSPSTTAPSYFRKRGGGGSSNGLPNFPRFIKLEEKRAIRNNPEPYCQQMQILWDGTIVPAGTPNILIEENDNAPASATSSAAAHKRGSGVHNYHDLVQRQAVGSSCCCEWLST